MDIDIVQSLPYLPEPKNNVVMKKRLLFLINIRSVWVQNYYDRLYMANIKFGNSLYH